METNSKTNKQRRTMNRNRTKSIDRNPNLSQSVILEPENVGGNNGHHESDGNNGNGAHKPESLNVSSLEQPNPAVAEAAPAGVVIQDLAYWVRKEKRPAVELDRGLILIAAENQSGESAVAQQHTAMFNSVWADLERVLKAVVHEMTRNMLSCEAHIRELAHRLKNTNRYIEVERKTVPWTFWDAVQFCAVIVFGLFLLGVDVNSAAVTLMESGIESFRNNWWRAALFNLSVIMGGAFVIKSVGNWLETDVARRRYAFTVLGLAGVALIAAVPVFAQTYSRLTADPLASMTASQTGAHDAGGWWIFALQLLVGNLVAGAMWLTAAQLVERHRPSVRSENPMWRQVKQDLDRYTAMLREEHEKLGLRQGDLDVIAAKRNDLLARAVEYYRLAVAEVAHRRKMQALIGNPAGK
jgi:hypothetical protein